MNIHLKKNHGFTMIEIIAVLLIMAIVTVVAVSKVASTSEYELKSQTAVIKSHLRYAQMRAIKSNGEWGINFPSSTTYSLFRNGDTTDTVALPGAGSDTVTLPSGVTVSTGTVSFDDWGSPYANATATGTSTDITITVTCNETEPILITKNTGYID